MSSFFSLPAAWFTVPAMVGTLVFLFKLTLMALAGHGVDHDGGAHGHAHDSHGDGHGSEASKAGQVFKLLSTQTIASALMGFGWTGYASLIGSDWPMFAHILIGFVAGFLSSAAMIWMLRQLSKMKSDGTVPRNALLGAEGEVYIPVPQRGNGIGQVRIVVNDRERFVNAVCESAPIPTKGRIMIVGTNPDNSVTVIPVE
ncbi:MAG: hypothetical protein IT435_00550 [Phycisphaerales bacterium]|nr:hypothetical protein [Phycisphaerales bacterium]